MQIQTFVETLARVPHRYGSPSLSEGTDCVLMLADFWMWLGRNRDLAEEHRGKYGEGNLEEYLISVGGKLRIIAKMCRELELPVVTRDFQDGDGGVVRYRRTSEHRYDHYGAIYFQGFWTLKVDHGVTFSKACRPVRIWRPKL